MKITMGNKKIIANTLIEEGRYDKSKFIWVKEGDKAKIGSEFLNTVLFGLEIDYGGEPQQKEKKMIVTDKKDSELVMLLEEFEHLKDQDGSINLMDLVGQKCEVEIAHNLSKRGNIFANIGEIRALDPEELEGDDVDEQ